MRPILGLGQHTERPVQFRKQNRRGWGQRQSQTHCRHAEEAHSHTRIALKLTYQLRPCHRRDAAVNAHVRIGMLSTKCSINVIHDLFVMGRDQNFLRVTASQKVH
eukprot:scaffold2182_cov198-Amphora_coffeaeformis.AAC.19